jgi:hypothetical protein
MKKLDGNYQHYQYNDQDSGKFFCHIYKITGKLSSIGRLLTREYKKLILTQQTSYK